MPEFSSKRNLILLYKNSPKPVITFLKEPVMENMFLRTVLRTRNFLGKSKTQKKKKKGKIEGKGFGIEGWLELLFKSDKWEFNMFLPLIRGFSCFTRMTNRCGLDYKGSSHMGIKPSVYRGWAMQIHTPLFISFRAQLESPG